MARLLITTRLLSRDKVELRFRGTLIRQMLEEENFDKKSSGPLDWVLWRWASYSSDIKSKQRPKGIKVGYCSLKILIRVLAVIYKPI